MAFDLLPDGLCYLYLKSRQKSKTFENTNEKDSTEKGMDAASLKKMLERDSRSLAMYLLR